ncbi:MAG: sodium-dependent transporter [Muribaculaceae bacterium]|nr:sodium-dependent transporter [Muribaculaceae bacterium]
MSQNNEFSSKLGLLLTTLGSAVGLGCIWRFPAEVQANGGGAFLLVFILCTIVLGIPVMLAEFTVGRAGKSDAISSLANLGARKVGWLVGGLGLLAGLLVLSFYAVVCGWTFEYLVASLTGDMFSGIDVNMPEEQIEAALQSKMHTMIHTPWLPLGATLLMLVATMGVLVGGVQNGIERLSKVMMPALFIVLIIFVVVAAMAPGATAGYEYFLKPDFSKITFNTVLAALGQAFFSLSLGMAILITYGSYFPKDTNLGKTSAIVAILGLLVAVMMGMIIFPLMLSFNQTEGIEGTTLLFMTMPELFVYMPMSWLWSALFFFLVLVAAMTSCVSFAEPLVALLTQRLGLKRLAACLIVLIPLVILSSICSLSQMHDTCLTVGGVPFFDFLNQSATDYLLTLSSVVLCVWLGWFAPKTLLRDQLTNEGSLKIWYYGIVRFTLRYVAPILILFVFLESFL